MNSIKYIWAEIKNAKKFSIFFIFNLSLGLFGFLSLEFFKESLQATLQDRSRAVLGADLATQSRRPFTPDEMKIVQDRLPQDHQKTQMIEIFSMAVKAGGRSTLVQIRAITPKFPFYGEIETQPQGLTSLSLNDSERVWIYPELAAQLGVNVGDSLRLGEGDFKIAGIVVNDSASGISTSMAPRVYIGFSQLHKTQLLRPGSLAWRLELYKLPSLDRLKLDELREEIFSAMPSADVQVYTHENASEQMGRLLKYLNDFLGLAAIVSLFICSLGIGFLCYTFLQNRLKNVAILISLGMSHLRAMALHIFQIVALSTISALGASLLSMLTLPAFQSLARRLVSFDIVFSFKPALFFLTLMACVVSSLFVLLPLLLRLRKVRPSLLLQDQNHTLPPWDLVSVLGFIPILLLFFGLSVWQTNSLKHGSIFFAAFMGAGITFYAIGFALIPLVRKMPQPKPLAWRWALRDLSRQKFSTLSCFLALAISLLLLNLIPQIERSISEEIKNPESSKLPGLFLFDIQEEQVPDLQTILTSKNVHLRDLSPLIRSRLLSVNGETFDKGSGMGQAKNRDQEREMQFRNRGFNLSYRDSLSASETIVEGPPLSNEIKDIAELSVEASFAERLGLKINDVLKFDIQNVPVEGRIVNLRKVQWTSFQPNFFVLFQPGFLEGAPKTFLATLPKLPADEKLKLQDAVVEKLPNISMIDIARLVERLQEIVFHISWSLKIMLLLSLIVGFTVLFSIANQQAAQRKWDIGLLKAMGAPPEAIAWSLLLQFAIIATLAAAFGFILSLAFSYVISHYLFNNLWFFDWKTPTLLLISSSLTTLLVTWLSVSRSLRTKASQLLTRS